jgi:RNA polymerase sigma-70 factor (ECF subfamily)
VRSGGSLFTEDAWLRMPPMPLEYRGRGLIGEFLRAVAFRDGRTYRLVPVRMNGQLAFESFLPGATAANDLLVLDVSTADPDALIAAMTRFPPSRPLGGRDGV